MIAKYVLYVNAYVVAVESAIYIGRKLTYTFPIVVLRYME